MKSLFPAVLPSLTVALLCKGVPSGLAQTWTPTSAPAASWARVATSADGTTLVAVLDDPSLPCSFGVYASTNSGITWVAPNDGGGTDVAGSADGTRWIVGCPYCCDLIFQYSPTQGWLLPTQTNLQASAVASSADGTRLVLAGSSILISTNSGLTWQTSFTNFLFGFAHLACSADGMVLIAAKQIPLLTQQVVPVYVSTNAGATWSARIVDSQWNASWNSVACSADGAKLFAAADDGVFLSNDAGETWNQIHSPDSFQSIAASADGTQLAASAKAGAIYTSTNGGITWTQSSLGDTNASLTTLAMSADGSRMFAAVQNGLIYSLQTTPPPPALRITTVGTNLCFLWPFPSSSFVLQETTDVTTNFWLDVQTPPSLNYTNLQNQIVVATPAQPTFFRLASYQTLQGTFQDLDFESATIVAIPGDMYQRIQFAPAFPGWLGYAGANLDGGALYNNLFLDSAGIGLQPSDSNWTSANFPEGRYSATIQSGFTLTFPLQTVTSFLSQSGFIPAGARSIHFKAIGNSFQVTLNGQLLSLVAEGEARYGTDITRFSGSGAELRFTPLPTPPPQPPMSILQLDSIYFSTRPVP